MILRLILKYFLSFDDEAHFDMFPNMKRTQLAGHVYTDLCDVPLLKKDAGKEPISLAVEFAQAADEAIAEATRKMLEKNPLASLMALNREFPMSAA